ncbi:MaoC family dehydratase N-terminal domain-containing protein [Ferrovibrio sp.]|uniref:FAS1-like dehydratase domain-containing protein n=2 Tax=Ferrovibrio sp. TaxID=1917215 RepID=UPI0025C2499F|nr:MaoC family dehydratase N-terminal domain-containing protein [Ferrovibrio sp.]
MAMVDLRDWVGRSETRTDTLRPEIVQALNAALGREDVLLPGTPLPALRHWLYFLDMQPRDALGRDGHARLGGFLPDVSAYWGMPARRMWAGSRIDFQAPLWLCEPVTRRSSIESISEKQGRAGKLVFVTVRHEIFDAADRLAITDRHDIVYRPDDALPAPAEAAPLQATLLRSFTADPVLLFRYSALTWNGHRIHYDRDYARDTEGYRGLVVHGPLLASLLADLAQDAQPLRPMRHFTFRARRPVMDGTDFTLCGQPVSDDATHLWIADADGNLAMQAEAQFL